MAWIDQSMCYIKCSQLLFSIIWRIKLQSVPKCRFLVVLVLSFEFWLPKWIETVSFFHFKLFKIRQRYMWPVIWFYRDIWWIGMLVWPFHNVRSVVESLFLGPLKITKSLSRFRSLIKNRRNRF